MRKIVIALSLAATTLAGVASAQRPDTDRIETRAQAAAAADARFTRMDTDRNGTVTPEERRAEHERMRAERDARVITEAQFKERAAKRFDRLDVNGDGKLTADERRAGHRGRGGHPRFGRGRPGGPPGAPAGNRPAPKPETAAEFRARALERFDRVDANRDGRIDQAERAAAHRMGPPPPPPGGPMPPPPPGGPMQPAAPAD